MLGLNRQNKYIYIDPRLPEDWNQYEISLRLGGNTHHILVQRSLDAKFTVELNDKRLNTFVLIEEDGDLREAQAPPEFGTQWAEGTV